jgi:hypothetical protein
VSFETNTPGTLTLRCGIMNGSFSVADGWIAATKVGELIVEPPVTGP